MKKPTKTKKKSAPYTETPKGGRAFQRIVQDRIARGLDVGGEPGTTGTGEKRAPKRRPGKKR